MGVAGCGARVVDAVEVGVNLNGVEFEHAARHPFGVGDAAHIVDGVGAVGEIEQLSVARKGERARFVNHRVDVFGRHLCGSDHRLAGVVVGFDMLAGNDEKGVDNRNGVVKRVLLSLDFPQHAAD